MLLLQALLEDRVVDHLVWALWTPPRAMRAVHAAHAAHATHAVPALALQAVLAALVLSILLAPIIVHYSDRLVLRFAASEWLMRSLQLTSLAARAMSNEKHALICGFGRSGQHLARFMADEEVSYLALDLDPDRVREAAAAGENVVYGNATRRETLVAAGVARASVLIISFHICVSWP